MKGKRRSWNMCIAATSSSQHPARPEGGGDRGSATTYLRTWIIAGCFQPCPENTPSLIPGLQPQNIPSLIPGPQPYNTPSLIPGPQPQNTTSLIPGPLPQNIPSLIPGPLPQNIPSLIPGPLPQNTTSLMYPRISQERLWQYWTYVHAEEEGT